LLDQWVLCAADIFDHGINFKVKIAKAFQSASKEPMVFFISIK